MTTDHSKEFCELYTKYLKGTKWLDSNTHTQEDEDEFCNSVLYPLDQLWKKLTEDEKKEVEYLMNVCDKTGAKSLKLKI